MICECGGILSVIKVEEYPENIKDKINYDRVCHVQCLSCHRTFYNQPYDWGKKFNIVKDIK